MAFAVLKSDGLVVDAMGVRQGLRRLGFDGALALELVRRAYGARRRNARTADASSTALPACRSCRAIGFAPAGGATRPLTAG